MANVAQNMVLSGLISQTATIQSAGPIQVIGSLTCPEIDQGDATDSQVVAVVSQNGTPMFTSAAGSRGFQVHLLCAALDTITVALSSGAPVDQPANVIKCTVAIG